MDGWINGWMEDRLPIQIEINKKPKKSTLFGGWLAGLLFRFLIIPRLLYTVITDLRKCLGSSSPTSSIRDASTDRDFSQVAVLPCCWSIYLGSKKKCMG